MKLKKILKPKILLVGGFPDEPDNVKGGVVTSCQLLLKSELREDFSLLTLDSTQITTKPRPIQERIFFSIIKFTRLISISIAQKPSVTILFASSGLSMVEKGLMGWVVRAFGSRVILFPRAGAFVQECQNSKVQLQFFTLLLQCAHLWLCQGKSWQVFLNKSLGVKAEKTQLVANWTASEELLKQGAQKLKKRACPKANLIFVGWLEENKGIFVLLEALKQVNLNGIDFQLKIAGDGTERESVTRFIVENRLDSKILLLGWVSEIEMRQLLNESNIFVLPSFSEGLPNALIEAMASGNACITTPVGAICDFVKNEETALVIPAKSTESLQKAISRLCSDTELKKQLAKNAHILASNTFSLSEGVRRLTFAIKQELSQIKK